MAGIHNRGRAGDFIADRAALAPSALGKGHDRCSSCRCVGAVGGKIDDPIVGSARMSILTVVRRLGARPLQKNYARTSLRCRSTPADQLLALLLLTDAIVSGSSVHWSCRKFDNQRAVASTLSSGIVLDAIDALGAAFFTALTTVWNNRRFLGGSRTPAPITMQYVVVASFCGTVGPAVA